jgi:hypothetical protein
LSHSDEARSLSASNLSSDYSDEEDQPVTYKYVHLDEKAANTCDAAMLGFLMLQYHFDLMYIVPIILHGISQAFQICLTAQFFLVIEGLEDMYETEQYDKVVDIMKNIEIHNLTLQGPFKNTSLYEDSIQFSKVYDWADGMCGKQLFPHSGNMTRYVTFFVLMLLFGRATSDIGNILWKQWVLAHLSKDSTHMEELDEKTLIALEKPPKKLHLAHANYVTEGLCFVFVFLPHFVCHIWIACLGAKYVCMMDQTDKIIKSAIKLYFITKFDGIIAKAFFAAQFKKLLKGACYKVPHRPGSARSFCDGELMTSFGTTVIKIIVGTIFSLITKYFLFPRKFHFAHLCDQYFDMFPALAPWNQLILGNVTPGLSWHNPFFS